ncbi:MAG: CPBP family intramembrane metalloprotease [Oscillospiraceae bacterium]|nr:CPBP family intramembrane metalloprotease [Oscillospiraceae bacterium]
MTNKQENAKRLAIYLLIVAASSVLPFFCMKWMQASETAFFLAAEVFCATPALASLITRAVTKEGFRDMKLHLHLKGNIRYYVLAFALSLFCTALMYVPEIILQGHADWLSGFTLTNVLTAVLMLAAQGAVMSAGLLGEELGWRGYMNRKLEPLVGIIGTVLIGGVVWSLWHMPSDMQLYLAGKESFSEAMQTVGGRLLWMPGYAAFYLWLTKKTDSVWPAVLAHAMGNASQSSIMGLLSQGNIPDNADLGSGMLQFVPTILMAVVFTALLLRDQKKAPKTV